MDFYNQISRCKASLKTRQNHIQKWGELRIYILGLASLTKPQSSFLIRGPFHDSQVECQRHERNTYTEHKVFT